SIVKRDDSGVGVSGPLPRNVMACIANETDGRCDPDQARSAMEAAGKARAWGTIVATCVLVGCGSSGQQGFAPGNDGSIGGDGTVGGDDGGSFTHDDGGGFVGDGGGGPPGDSGVACNPTSEDLQGCNCPSAGTTRACYTGDPKTRNVGTCKDGTQTCV